MGWLSGRMGLVHEGQAVGAKWPARAAAYDARTGVVTRVLRRLRRTRPVLAREPHAKLRAMWEGARQDARRLHAAAGREALARRTIRVLLVSQVLAGAGLAAGITVGALLAEDMLGSTSSAGLPTALFTLGSAAAAILVGRLSQASGRRPGLAAGYAVGAIGGAGIVLAAAIDNVPLLFVALLLYGSGIATNLQARYAGADLVAPERRGRAVSTVLVATTLGAVAGPNLVDVDRRGRRGDRRPRARGPVHARHARLRAGGGGGHDPAAARPAAHRARVGRRARGRARRRRRRSPSPRPTIPRPSASPRRR